MKLSFNLASRRYVSPNVLNVVFIGCTLLLLLALGFVIPGYVHTQRQLDVWESRVVTLSEQHNRLKNKYKQPSAKENPTLGDEFFYRVDFLLKYENFDWSVLLTRMEGLLPDGAYLVNFRPDYDERRLSITGVAKDLSSLQELLGNLQRDNFEYAYLTSHKHREKDNKATGGLDFTIELGGVF